MPSPEIVTLGELPVAPGRPEWIRDRILSLVTEGAKWPTYDDDAPIRWKHRPGFMPWWAARQLEGGRVMAEEFARGVEDLLGEGLLIEVRLVRRDMREAPHLLVQPGKLRELPRKVAQVQGLPEVIAREPWAATIGAKVIANRR